ncbi:MAG: hypothetical protein MJA84_07155 [Firmicutes bacterium]|nr:hypothetical protein [Bacillota bacterium]
MANLKTIGPIINDHPLNDNFNAINDEVASLAGTGRTTETVKGNADAIAAHLADYVNPHKVAVKNILHNWDFRNPINQRGQSSYSANGYTIDRWKLATTYGSNVLTVEDGFIKLTAGASTSTRSGCLIQILEQDFLPYVGKTFTLSFNVSAYTGSWGSRIRFADGGTYLGQAVADISETGIVSVTGTIPATCDTIRVELQTVAISAGDYLSLLGAKFELGSKSTLSNDPPVDYGEQLALCQRYYEKTFPLAIAPAQNVGDRAGAIIVNIGSISYGYMCWEYKVRKRATPTITTYNPFAANANVFVWNEGVTTSESLTNSTVSETNYIVEINRPTINSSRALALLHATADAEL